MVYSIGLIQIRSNSKHTALSKSCSLTTKDTGICTITICTRVYSSSYPKKEQGPTVRSDINDIAVSLKGAGKAVPRVSTSPTARGGPCSSCFTIEHIHHRVRNHINTCPFPHLGES